MRTCSPCNTRKSELEDDIAAISTQPDVFGKYPVTDDALGTSAKRKAEGSVSRKTKKPVKDSQAQLSVSGQLLTGLVANFSFTGSPQIDDHRIIELARYVFSITDKSPCAAKERLAYSDQWVRAQTGFGADGAVSH